MMQQVLVVDDDTTITKIIQAYLEQAGFRVSVVHDGPAVLNYLEENQPSLVVLDLMLPEIDGFSLIRHIRHDKRWSDIPIILLTARQDSEDKIQGLELGADDYVTKPFNPRELLARIRAVLRRKHPEDQAQANVLEVPGMVLDLDRRSLHLDTVEVELTKTEFSLLEQFMANPGYTLTRDELLEKALGYSWEGMGRTLDTHIRNLRRKIEPQEDALVRIETVHGVGYRFRLFAPGEVR